MTTKENWPQIKELFHLALELAPQERGAYLDSACAGNKSLQQEIQTLLELHEKTGEFIDAPAYQVFADMLANAEEFKPGEKLAHYEIRYVLAEGGMGKVYLAEDTKLKRNVALKVLPLANAGDESARRRLLREARAAAALDHPNICAIYEVGEESGRSYIAMQYIKGETLDARMMKGRLRATWRSNSQWKWLMLSLTPTLTISFIAISSLRTFSSQIVDRLRCLILDWRRP